MLSDDLNWLLTEFLRIQNLDTNQSLTIPPEKVEVLAELIRAMKETALNLEHLNMQKQAKDLAGVSQ